MKIYKTKQIFLVLVPHRDTRLVLRGYGGELSKAGFSSECAFPRAAPLAVLSRPLNSQELKNIAHALRKSAIDGKFNAEEAQTIPFPPEEKNSFLLGPRLNFTLPAELLNGKGSPLASTVIGLSLLSGGLNGNTPSRHPKLSFSAAAVANMHWQSVKVQAQAEHAAQQAAAQAFTFGYKWKIGKLCWLPKKAAQSSAD